MRLWNKKNNVYLGLIFSLLLCWTMTCAKANSVLSSFPKAPSVENAFTVNVSYQQNKIQIIWEIAPHCYLYQNQLKLNLIAPENPVISLMDLVKFPKAEKIDDPDFGQQAIYRHSLVVALSLDKILKAQRQESMTLQIEYQGCAESLLCYPPITKWFKIDVEKNQITQIKPLPEAPGIASTLSQDEHTPNLSTSPERHHIVRDIATFYFYGILLTFTPCVLPMIPILFGVIVGQKHLNTRKAFWLSLCYVLSMAFTYAVAGIIVATLGKNLQAQLQQPAAIITFSVLFALLGLTQLGVFQISFLNGLKLKNWLHKFHLKQESGTYLGAAIMGMLATLISSPCVTAPLILALGYISHSGNIFLGASALLSLGLGMGTILLILGTFGSKFIPKSGPWMHTVNHAFGIIMLALSLWLLQRLFHSAWLLLLWGALCLFTAWCMDTFRHRVGVSGRIGVLFVVYALILFWGAWLGENDPLKPLRINPWQIHSATAQVSHFQTIYTLEDLAQQQTLAKKQSLPMMVVFFADWCISCQHLEKTVFSNERVQAQLSHWKLIQADVTANNKGAQLLLKEFDLIGPPTILFFDKNGSELPKYRISGEVSVKDFLSQLESIDRKIKG